VNPERIELAGLVLVVLAIAAGITATFVLAGWPWALVTFAVSAVLGGVSLIRTAALTPPTETPKGGESA